MNAHLVFLFLTMMPFVIRNSPIFDTATKYVVTTSFPHGLELATDLVGTSSIGTSLHSLHRVLYVVNSVALLSFTTVCLVYPCALTFLMVRTSLFLISVVISSLVTTSPICWQSTHNSAVADSHTSFCLPNKTTSIFSWNSLKVAIRTVLLANRLVICTTFDIASYYCWLHFRMRTYSLVVQFCGLCSCQTTFSQDVFALLCCRNTAVCIILDMYVSTFYLPCSVVHDSTVSVTVAWHLFNCICLAV